MHRQQAALGVADQQPVVVEALAERGISLTEAYPKPLTDSAVRAADVIITMLIDHPFELQPEQQVLSWDFDDPAGLSTDEVRRIRDRVRRQVQQYLDALD